MFKPGELVFLHPSHFAGKPAKVLKLDGSFSLLRLFHNSEQRLFFNKYIIRADIGQTVQIVSGSLFVGAMGKIIRIHGHRVSIETNNGKHVVVKIHHLRYSDVHITMPDEKIMAKLKELWS